MSMEFMESRRKFLKGALGATAGAVILSQMAPLAALAEEAKPEKEPFKWVANAAPCKLIEETTTAETPAGTRSFKFTTDGRACSKSVTFDIVGAEQLLQNVVYDGGCNGGTQGIAVMCEGRPAAEVANLLKGVICDLKKSGSSCGMQLAMGIQQSLMIINGTPCAGCGGTVCENAK